MKKLLAMVMAWFFVVGILAIVSETNASNRLLYRGQDVKKKVKQRSRLAKTKHRKKISQARRDASRRLKKRSRSVREIASQKDQNGFSSLRSSHGRSF